MQDQEKSFLRYILYLFLLVVSFAAGVAYQFKMQVIPVAPTIVEVTQLVKVPEIIETTRVIEKECTIPTTEKKGWFK